MRARSLKPKLFKNELLGGVDPLITILFEGLWCCADREGRLEDRPLRLCAEVFPYRRAVTEKKVDGWLDWLHAQEFVTRYEVAGQRFIQVLAFHKHQKPHSKEKDSEIPPLSSGVPLPRSGRAPTKVRASTDQGSGEHALTPDSGLLTPDCSLRERAREAPRPEEAGLEAWRDVGCDPQAMESWLEHLAKHHPPKALPAHARIHAAQVIRGFGDPDTQRRTIQHAIANNWRSLRVADGKGSNRTGRKTMTERLAALDTPDDEPEARSA